MRLKEKLVFVAATCILCGAGLKGQSPGYGSNGISKMFLDARAPDMPPRYSRKEIKQMVEESSSPEDFKRLADYFDFQSLVFQQKERDEAKELEQLLAQRYHARSYPIQVDNARELILRYRSKKQECSARADAYRERISAGQ